MAGRTDVGLVREHNEDSFVVIDLTSTKPLDLRTTRTIDVGDRGVLLVVCDGMGGAAAGEIASAMAVDTVCEVMNTTAEPADLPLEERTLHFAHRMRHAAYVANQRIYEAARVDPTKGGMGTTMTAVGVIDGQLIMAQVGDSRAYLLRSGTITQITRDQSLLNELLDTGQITEEQAVMFEHSNVILQALGVQPEVEVLLSRVELRRDDRIVVCSDGLTSVVVDEEIGKLAMYSDDMAECCRLLIELARVEGGPDNITAIVARFEGEGLRDPAGDEPPVRYTRWLLDDYPLEEDFGEQTLRIEAPAPPLPTQSQPPRPPPRQGRRVDFAQTFFSAMLLFAMLVGSLILGSLLYRGRGVSCQVMGAPGLSIHVDGFDTGVRTGTEPIELRLREGQHRIHLEGPGAPAGDQTLEVVSGATCVAHFGSTP